MKLILKWMAGVLILGTAVQAEPITFTAYSEAAGLATPPAGWNFYWNAPDGWDIGVTGDLATGAVSNRASWKPLVWSGSMWTADGDNVANNSPADYLRAVGGGGHPGSVGATRELDRYVISAFTISQAGDYEILLGKVATLSGGNGAQVKIFVNGALYDELLVPNDDAADFSTIFNGMALNDEIAVAVGANGDIGFDTYSLDFRIALLKPEFSAPQIINVADYGAVGDGIADDGPSVLAAINAWKGISGPASLLFETNKTYSLGEKTDAKAYFVLNGITNKVVEGNGAELIFTPSNRGFDITACDGIVVRNFSVDYSPKSFTQGLILSKTGNGFIFQPSAGYPDPILIENKHWGSVFDPATTNLRAGVTDHIFLTSITDLGNGTFEMQVDPASIGNLPGIQLDDWFVFRAYPVTAIPGSDVWAAISYNGTVGFDNVNLQCAPMFAFWSGYNSKPCLFRNITISPPPGSGRLVSSYGDGFHCNDNRFGPVIEGGTFTYLMDDAMNIKTTGFRVTELVGGNILKLATINPHVGDVLQFTLGFSDVIGEATVVAVNGNETELDSLPAGINTNDTRVFNLSLANAGYVVQNNYFGKKRRFSGIIRCGEGKVLNNVSDGNDGWSVGNELFGTTHEGPFARNILYQGNTMRNARYGLVIRTWQASTLLPRPIQDIRILDNIFEDLPNLSISDAGNVLIEGNQFWVTPIAELNRIEAVTFGGNLDQYGQLLTGGASLLTGNYNANEVVFTDEPIQMLSPVGSASPDIDLVATFNEDMTIGSGSITISNLTDATADVIAVTDAAQVSIAGSVLTINPSANLLIGRDYAVLIDPGAVEDLFGNPFPGITTVATWSFSIVDPSVLVFNGDFSGNAVAFTNYPGYVGVGNPSSIEAWIDVGGSGINGDGLFRDFGPVTQSAVNYFAFLQGSGTQLRQDIGERLAPNTTYKISYLAANRAINPSALGRVTVADFGTTYYDSGIQPWSAIAFQLVSAEFTTGASFDGQVLITLRNDSPAGDNTVVYSNIEIVKVTDYDNWAQGYDLTGTDAAATNDIEPDGLDNLLEYALGGNPTNADAASVLPSFQSLESWFYHAHNERTDDTSLTYTVQLNTNLVAGTWTTNGVERTGESGVENNFKSVTNRTDIGDGEFMRLRIEQE